MQPGFSYITIEYVTFTVMLPPHGMLDGFEMITCY